MKTLTSQYNHLQQHYGDLLQANYADKLPWIIQQGERVRESFDWRSEVVLSFQQIIKSIGSGYQFSLYYDGNIASLSLAYLLVLNRISFRFLAVKMSADQNKDQLFSMIKFCEHYNVSYHLIDINPIDFLNSPVTLSRAQKYRTDSLSQLLQMEAWAQHQAKNLKDFVFFSHGLVSIEHHQSGWKVSEHEKDFALMRFQADHQLIGLSHFYRWSPELIHAFLSDEQIKNIFTVKGLETADSLVSKYYFKFIRSHIPLPDYQPMNGFEKIKAECDLFSEKLNTSLTSPYTAYLYDYEDYVSKLKIKSIKVSQDKNPQKKI